MQDMLEFYFKVGFTFSVLFFVLVAAGLWSVVTAINKIVWALDRINSVMFNFRTGLIEQLERMTQRAAPLTWNKQLVDYFKSRKNEEGILLCEAVEKIIRRRRKDNASVE